jgi:GTP-binding protein LepA
MDIVQERLEREHGNEVVQTAPTVPYEVKNTKGEVKEVDSAGDLPEPNFIEEIREPFVRVDLIVPTEGIGAIMKLSEERRSIYIKTEYLSSDRVIITSEFPLAEIIYDFYDKLKSATRGYGTMDYEVIGFKPNDLVKVDILVNNNKVDALSFIVHHSKAEARGRAVIQKLLGSRFSDLSRKQDQERDHDTTRYGKTAGT